MTRVLITEDAPAYGVLAAVRALHAAGHETWVAVAERESYAARSRRCAGVVRVPDPRRDRGAHVAALADAARTIGATVVLPGTEAAMLALSGSEDAFGRAVRVGGCAPHVTMRATDKEAVAALAADAGLDTPPTIALSSTKLVAYAASLSYPAVAKTPRSLIGLPTGGLARGTVRRVHGPGDARRLVGDFPHVDRWLLQSCIDGTLAAVSGVAWCGELIQTIHQRAERVFPADCGISAVAVTVPPDGALEAAVGRLIERLGWSGLFQLQFLERDGRRHLIDLNPRVYGSLALAVGAGANLPAAWVELVSGGRPADAGGYRVGVRYTSEERYAGALLTDWRAGRRRAALRGLRPRHGTTHAVFSAGDPFPLLTMAVRLGRAARLLETSAAPTPESGEAQNLARSGPERHRRDQVPAAVEHGLG